MRKLETLPARRLWRVFWRNPAAARLVEKILPVPDKSDGESMRYWIFKCNPDRYRIDERLKDAESNITWRVTRYKDEIQMGDIAFIWRCGRERGIRAVMQIDSSPKEIPEIENEKKYIVDPCDVRVRLRVEGRIIRRFDCISHKELRNIPTLGKLSVFSGYQKTTNFRLTDREGEILMALAETQQAKMV